MVAIPRERQDGHIDLHGVERQLSEVEFAQQQHASVVTVVEPQLRNFSPAVGIAPVLDVDQRTAASHA